MNDFPLLASCDPSVCFSSRMMRMDRIISGIFRKYISPYGLTNSQLSILFVIAKNGSISQQGICEALYLEKSSTSRNMRRLMQYDYIKRNNLRHLEITTSGNALMEEIIPEWERAMAEVRSVLGKMGIASFDLVYNRITKT